MANKFPTKKKKRQTPEEDIQKICIKFLRNLRKHGVPLQFVHPANELLRTSNMKLLYWALGVEGGVPDLIIFLSGGRTIFIELKIKTKKLDGNQLDWEIALKKLGFKHYLLSVPDATIPSRIDAQNQLAQILIENGLNV